jgi:hypothetical protein
LSRSHNGPVRSQSNGLPHRLTGGPVGEIGEELARVRETPPELVRAEIATCLERVQARGLAVERQLRSREAGVLLADLLGALSDGFHSRYAPAFNGRRERFGHVFVE